MKHTGNIWLSIKTKLLKIEYLLNLQWGHGCLRNSHTPTSASLATLFTPDNSLPWDWTKYESSLLCWCFQAFLVLIVTGNIFFLIDNFDTLVTRYLRLFFLWWESGFDSLCLFYSNSEQTSKQNCHKKRLINFIVINKNRIKVSLLPSLKLTVWPMFSSLLQLFECPFSLMCG